MTHERRIQLASDLCDRMVTSYPDDVILGGVYGSAARGTDTAWSDLDMLFVVRDESQIVGKYFIFRNIAVGYQVITQQKLEELLSNPSLEWPLWMGILSVLKVLHGDTQQIQAWLRLGQSAPVEKCKETLETSLPELVVESYCRIFSCRERGNTDDVGCAVIEVLFEMNKALCLLNQRWITHDYYQGFIDAFSFPKLPEGYEELVTALWVARDINKIVPLAATLVQNFWRLLSHEGVNVKNYHTVNDLPL